MTASPSAPSAQLPAWQRRLLGAVVAIFRGYVRALGALSRPAAYRVARVMVPILLAANRAKQRRNLERYFGGPLTGRPDRTGLPAAINRYEARVHVDFSRLNTLSRRELCDWVTLEGSEHLDAALSQGRGVFLVTDHAGTSWLAVPTLLAARGYPVHMVANPMSAPGVDDWLTFVAERFGVQLSFVGRGVPRVAQRALAANQVFCVTFDVSTNVPRSDWLPFGGTTLPVDPGPALLASRFGAPVLQVTSAHDSTWGLTVTVHPPTVVDTNDGGRPDPTALSRRWLDVLEQQIASQPAAWWPWSYVGLGDEPAVGPTSAGQQRLQ